MNKLISFFEQGVSVGTLKSVGAEVETQFVDKYGNPIPADVSQRMLRNLLDRGWKIQTLKSDLITSMVNTRGDQISYELGKQNLEVSTSVSTSREILPKTLICLEDLYLVAEKSGAFPLFEPVLWGDEDLLMIPDERDANWLKLDGREALAPLARTSSVQFTISVSRESAITVLNNLGRNIQLFLSDYPQEVVWRKYIEESAAGYRADRYGGPLEFESMQDYCQKLSKNEVVVGPKLVPYSEVENVDIPLYLRSIWWYFRLKRYGEALCVEVRPMPRREDRNIQTQLETVISLFES